MVYRVLCVFSFVLISSSQATEQYDIVKRGENPFMAFIYYVDDTIMDRNTLKFFRGAILVTPQYLVSASMDPLSANAFFPRKTMIARVGALTVTANVALDESVGEQDREVVQIMRPTNHSMESWWLSDITVLKVLEPFTLTPSAAYTHITTSTKHYANKICNLLVYDKQDAYAVEMTLMRVAVNVLPNWKCGKPFKPDRMMCSLDKEQTPENLDHCQVTIGGPMICDDEVVGIQSYIPYPKCKPPQMYQRLHFWDEFINCSIQNECSSEKCQRVCFITDKDEGSEKSLGEELTLLKGVTTSSALNTSDNNYELIEKIEHKGDENNEAEKEKESEKDDIKYASKTVEISQENENEKNKEEVEKEKPNIRMTAVDEKSIENREDNNEVDKEDIKEENMDSKEDNKEDSTEDRKEERKEDSKEHIKENKKQEKIEDNSVEKEHALIRDNIEKNEDSAIANKSYRKGLQVFQTIDIHKSNETFNETTTRRRPEMFVPRNHDEDISSMMSSVDLLRSSSRKNAQISVSVILWHVFLFMIA